MSYEATLTNKKYDTNYDRRSMRMSPPYSISPYVTVYPRMFPYIPVYPRISPYIPVYPRISHHVATSIGPHPRISPYIPVYLRISPSSPVYRHLLPYIPVYPRISPYIPVYRLPAATWRLGGSSHHVATCGCGSRSPLYIFPVYPRRSATMPTASFRCLPISATMWAHACGDPWQLVARGSQPPCGCKA